MSTRTPVVHSSSRQNLHDSPVDSFLSFISNNHWNWSGDDKIRELDGWNCSR